eukprot:scaffold55939_cov54-Phaeocystis_antarctica.AAC.1
MLGPSHPDTKVRFASGENGADWAGSAAARAPAPAAHESVARDLGRAARKPIALLESRRAAREDDERAARSIGKLLCRFGLPLADQQGGLLALRLRLPALGARLAGAGHGGAAAAVERDAARPSRALRAEARAQDAADHAALRGDALHVEQGAAPLLRPGHHHLQEPVGRGDHGLRAPRLLGPLLGRSAALAAVHDRRLRHAP